MYDPQRLRILIERVGHSARPLATRQLRYWHAKTNPFPHADRECKDLRSPNPIEAVYALADMGDEGWCCHMCGIDPPDDDLGDVLRVFEAMEALPHDIGQREPNDLVGQVHRAYRLVAMARTLRRSRGAVLVGEYIDQVLDSYELRLADARRRWNRDTLRISRGPLGRFSVDASQVIETEDEDDFGDLDWLILERGTPVLNDWRRAAVDLPYWMVERRIGVDIYSLGAAARPTPARSRNRGRSQSGQGRATKATPKTNVAKRPSR